MLPIYGIAIFGFLAPIVLSVSQLFFEFPNENSWINYLPKIALLFCTVFGFGLFLMLSNGLEAKSIQDLNTSLSQSLQISMPAALWFWGFSLLFLMIFLSDTKVFYLKKTNQATVFFSSIIFLFGNVSIFINDFFATLVNFEFILFIIQLLSISVRGGEFKKEQVFSYFKQRAVIFFVLLLFIIIQFFWGVNESEIYLVGLYIYILSNVILIPKIESENQYFSLLLLVYFSLFIFWRLSNLLNVHNVNFYFSIAQLLITILFSIKALFSVNKISWFYWYLLTIANFLMEAFILQQDVSEEYIIFNAIVCCLGAALLFFFIWQLAQFTWRKSFIISSCIIAFLLHSFLIGLPSATEFNVIKSLVNNNGIFAFPLMLAGIIITLAFVLGLFSRRAMQTDKSQTKFINEIVFILLPVEFFLISEFFIGGNVSGNGIIVLGTNFSSSKNIYPVGLVACGTILFGAILGVFLRGNRLVLGLSKIESEIMLNFFTQLQQRLFQVNQKFYENAKYVTHWLGEVIRTNSRNGAEIVTTIDKQVFYHGIWWELKSYVRTLSLLVRSFQNGYVRFYLFAAMFFIYLGWLVVNLKI